MQSWRLLLRDVAINEIDVAVLSLDMPVRITFESVPEAEASGRITFIAPAIWLTYQPWHRLEHVWLLSVGSVVLQSALAMWLLARTFRRKLGAATDALPAPAE